MGTANAAAAVVQSVADSLAAAASNNACRPGRPDWTQRPLNFIAPVESVTWPVGCDADPRVRDAGGPALCRELARVAKHRELVLTIVDDRESGAADALASFVHGAPKQQLLVVGRGAGAVEAARLAGGGGAGLGLLTAGVEGSPVRASLAELPPVAFKYAIIGAGAPCSWAVGRRA